MSKKKLLASSVAANIVAGITTIFLLAYLWDKVSPLITFLASFVLGALLIIVLIKKGILNVRHSTNRRK